jgi:ankyrin repeat/BTB/POZ domain-containing protein 1
LDSADITILAFHGGSAMLDEFRLHKFLLAARSPYFRRKFKEARPEKEKHRPYRTVRMTDSIDSRAFETAVKFMYLGEVTDAGDEEVAINIERLSRHLEIPELWDLVMVAGDQKQRRATRTEAVEKAQEEMDTWFREVVLPGKIVVDNPDEVEKLRVEQNNDSFADLVLAAEDDLDEVEDGDRVGNGAVRKGPRTVLYPVHKGMLRSEFFTTMLTSPFKEGRKPEEHEALPVVPIDVSPPVLELVLSFLYSEKTEIPLIHALDLLFAAEQLLIDRLKLKCSHVICTADSDDLPYSIYDVVRVGWLCRVRRLEEFGAKYIAERLEDYLDDPELAELVAESAERIKERQETDTIELVDDIRYYLGVRFTQRIGKEDALFEGEDAATEEGLALEIGGEEDVEVDEDPGLDPLLERRERRLEDLLGRIDLLLGELLLAVISVIG